jgi:hypothetical protein
MKMEKIIFGVLVFAALLSVIIWGIVGLTGGLTVQVQAKPFLTNERLPALSPETSASPATLPPTYTTIGYLAEIPSLAGKVDDFRIYNRALSTNEVAELYANGSAPPQGFLKKVWYFLDARHW